jgi:hypothetical protein
MRVVITDESAPGRETSRLLLDGVPNRILLRDLIRHRVREEVVRFNARPTACFSGLVQPAGSRPALGGYLLLRPRTLDWEAQADAALEAFERNGFFVFVGGRQLEDLDEELSLADSDVVSFLRLVPLAGG